MPEENGQGGEDTRKTLARHKTEIDTLKSEMSRIAANHKLTLSDTASDLRAEMEVMRTELLQTLQAAVVYILDEEDGEDEEYDDNLEDAAATKLQAAMRGRRARRPHRSASNMSIDALFDSLPDMAATLAERSSRHSSPMPREEEVVFAPLTAEADRRRSSPFAVPADGEEPVPVPALDAEEGKEASPPALATKAAPDNAEIFDSFDLLRRDARRPSAGSQSAASRRTSGDEMAPHVAGLGMGQGEATPQGAAGVVTVSTATDEPIPVHELLALRRKIDRLLTLAGVDAPESPTGDPDGGAAASSMDPPSPAKDVDRDANLDSAFDAPPAPKQDLLQEIQKGWDGIVQNMTSGWFWIGRGK